MSITATGIRIESKCGNDFNCLDSVCMPESYGMIFGVKLFEYGVSVLVKKDNSVFLYALPSAKYLPLIKDSGYEILFVSDPNNKLKESLVNKISGI